MKRVLSFLVCAALITAGFSSCIIVNFSDQLRRATTGTGDLERFMFSVGTFNRIRVEGHCDINYYNDHSNTVSLDVQPNLHKYYVIEVISGELVVRTKGRIIPSSGKTPVLTVSVPELNSLNLLGAGTFTAHDTISTDTFTLKLSGAGTGRANLDVNRLVVDMSGAGSFRLSGFAEEIDFRLSGAGELDAFALDARDAKVGFSGAGTVRVGNSENLTINASGMGSVEYKGSPRINLNNSGMVRVRRID